MKVFVKTSTGNHFEIEVKPEHTVADVKKIIESGQGANIYPASQQMLIYQGKALKDGTTLEENKIAENSSMVIMLTKGCESKSSSAEGSTAASTAAAMPTPKGIPKQDEVPSLAQSNRAKQPANISSVPQQPIQPASVSSSKHNANPLNLFPWEFPNLGSDAAAAGALDFLRYSEQFQALRAMAQADPQSLQPMLQEFGKQNPNVMRLIQEHQAEFHRLINEPIKGEEGSMLGQLASAMPQAIQVTTEEHAAIERLEAMGFGRSTVLEVFFACNKNEELAANYLIDHVHEFED